MLPGLDGLSLCRMVQRDPATHAKMAAKTEEKRINPLKASKRGAAGR